MPFYGAIPLRQAQKNQHILINGQLYQEASQLAPHGHAIVMNGKIYQPVQQVQQHTQQQTQSIIMNGQIYQPVQQARPAQQQAQQIAQQQAQQQNLYQGRMVQFAHTPPPGVLAAHLGGGVIPVMSGNIPARAFRGYD